MKRILSVRRLHRIRLEDLATLKVNLKRALPFVITSDHNPHVFAIDALSLRDRISPRETQIDLFGAHRSAITGQL